MKGRDPRIFWGSFLFLYCLLLFWTAFVINRKPPLYLAEAKILVPLSTPPQPPEGLKTLPRRGELNPGTSSFFFSDDALKEVIRRMMLVPEWSSFDQYVSTLSELKAQTDVRSLAGETIIRVRAFSEDPAQAKEIADTLATSVVETRYSGKKVMCLKALFPQNPFQPQKGRNLLVAAIAGFLVALPAASLIQKSLSSLESSKKKKP